MGLRFYRRIRVFPGITLSLSRRGLSTSVGVKGAHVTVGHGQVRETVGLPGSGISYTESQRLARADGAGAEQVQGDARGRFTFGRVLRWLVVGFFAFFLASVLVVWLIATFAPGP